MHSTGNRYADLPESDESFRILWPLVLGLQSHCPFCHLLGHASACKIVHFMIFLCADGASAPQGAECQQVCLVQNSNVLMQTSDEMVLYISPGKRWFYLFAARRNLDLEHLNPGSHRLRVVARSHDTSLLTESSRPGCQ